MIEIDKEHDSGRIRRRLPDYFKAIEMPWHIAASFMAAFVDDDEESLGIPSHHARNLFHVAKALNLELESRRAALAASQERVEALPARQDDALAAINDALETLSKIHNHDDDLCGSAICLGIARLELAKEAAALTPAPARDGRKEG